MDAGRCNLILKRGMTNLLVVWRRWCAGNDLIIGAYSMKAVVCLLESVDELLLCWIFAFGLVWFHMGNISSELKCITREL